MLGCTRAEILKTVGYDADWAFPDTAELEEVDLVLACHTLSSRELEVIVHGMHQRCALFLLPRDITARRLLDMMESIPWSRDTKAPKARGASAA
jgi:hypothetical protein